MNQTTPKSIGINYAKLRKQKGKEETLPKSMSTNLKFDIYQNYQHGILKHRSTSQHNINEYTQQQQQMQLFEQYFNHSKISFTFIEFVTKQIQYHNQPIQKLINPNIFKNSQRKWEEERRKILYELNQQKEDNCILQTELHDLKRQKNTLSKQCDNLQVIIVQERLGKQQRHQQFYQHKFQELTKNFHIPTQETISSLTDERFESNETSLDSSLSNEDDDPSIYSNQLFEILQTGKHRYQFSKKLN
ncbi:unnamed protein product [Paramecium primaurelia]|uniref:Uncharacterized protein n=1 Tax=Paramecium primaurelia TaxID=5886 RepID=A0A8S1LP19_PARPR|nr:unnamed protein product [Paramecium primaurelia]